MCKTHSNHDVTGEQLQLPVVMPEMAGGSAQGPRRGSAESMSKHESIARDSLGASWSFVDFRFFIFIFGGEGQNTYIDGNSTLLSVFYYKHTLLFNTHALSH